MTITPLGGLATYGPSHVRHAGTLYFLVAGADGKRLGVRGDTTGFEGVPHTNSGALMCRLTPETAAVLRERLPWLAPVPLGLATSAGFGDRLGSATPGHVAAVRGTGVAPIFAQQSVRENARTRRTPQQVLDDAMWGVFQAGWRDSWGADADHLKTLDDIPPFVAAGYTFYTVDPGEYVDGEAETDSVETLRAKVAALSWEAMGTSWDDLSARLLGQVDLETVALEFDELTLLRAAAKYGRILPHILTMYERLLDLMSDRSFDFEVSVDETETPTSLHEHYYIATELRRLGVDWVSLAPRFVGRFEKGVDYIGDLDELDANLAGHAAVMRHFGGYKLSLHSGSDKFSIYSLAAQHTDGLVHLKTAGTSYLEALRVMAEVRPVFFREILEFSRAHFERDRATYHVSAVLDRVPAEGDLSDSALPALLDDFDARQVLHVTYGSVLEVFGARLAAAIADTEGLYHATLERHFDRHLASFALV